MQVLWLPRAVENLQEIHTQIAEEQPVSVEKVAQSIKQAVAMLEDHPQLGKPSLLDGFRKIQVADFPLLIAYKVEDGKLIVVRVFRDDDESVSIF